MIEENVRENVAMSLIRHQNRKQWEIQNQDSIFMIPQSILHFQDQPKVNISQTSNYNKWSLNLKNYTDDLILETNNTFHPKMNVCLTNLTYPFHKLHIELVPKINFKNECVIGIHFRGHIFIQKANIFVKQTSIFKQNVQM